MFQQVQDIASRQPKSIQALSVLKSQRPANELTEYAEALDAAGILVSGLAIGPEAAEIAQYMFPNTQVAEDVHSVRERMGETMVHLLDLADPD